MRFAVPPRNRGIPVARLAAGLGPFNPYDVAETAGWFSPRAGITLTSAKVSSWATQSPALTYAGTQATAGRRPVQDTGINGNPSVLFDAAATNELANTTQAIVANGATRYILATGKLTDAGGGALFTFRSGNPSMVLYVFATGGTTYYYGDGISEAAGEATAGAPDFTAPFLIEWEMTLGALPVVRVNGASRTLSGSNVADDAGVTGFRFGSSFAVGQYWPGHIGDLYIATGIPSAGDKAKLRTYFAALNGITL